MAFRTRTTETTINGYTLKQGDKASFKPVSDIKERPGNIHYDPEMAHFFDGTEYTFNKTIGDVIHDEAEFAITEDTGWAFHPEWVKAIKKSGPTPTTPASAAKPVELRKFTFDNLKVGDIVTLRPMSEQLPSGNGMGDITAPRAAYDGKTPVKVIGLEEATSGLSALLSGGGYVALEYPNGYRQDTTKGIFFARLQGWYVEPQDAAKVTEVVPGTGSMQLAPGKKYVLKSQDECEYADEGTGVMYDMPFGQTITVSGSIRPMGSGYEFHIEEDGGRWWYFDKWLKPLNEVQTAEVSQAEEVVAPLDLKKGDKVILRPSGSCLATKTVRPVREYMKDADGVTVVTVAEVDDEGDFLIEEDQPRNGIFEMWYSPEWILLNVTEEAIKAEEAPASLPKLTMSDLRGLDGSDLDALLINRFPEAKAIVLKTADPSDPYLMFIPADFLDEDGVWEYEVGGEALGDDWGNYKFLAGDLDTEAEGCGNTELHSYRCKYLHSLEEVQDALDTIKSITVKAKVNGSEFVAGVA